MLDHGYESRQGDGLDETELLGGTPLAIRFYDAPVMGEATYFNAVSDSTGAWNAINSPTTLLTMTLSLAGATLIWQDAGSSAFRTTLPIPEPAGGALVAGGFFALCLRRGRGDRVDACHRSLQNAPPVITSKCTTPDGGFLVDGGVVGKEGMRRRRVFLAGRS